MATVLTDVLGTLIDDMASDDLGWRPFGAVATERIRGYVAADIAAGRSTLGSLDELDDLIGE